MGTSNRYKWPNLPKHAKELGGSTHSGESPSSPLITDDRIDPVADEILTVVSGLDNRESIMEPIVKSATPASQQLWSLCDDVIAGRREWEGGAHGISRTMADLYGDAFGVHDTAVRQAIVETLSQLDLEVAASRAADAPLNSRLFCLLYQLFHRELLTNIVLHLLCESVLPGISTVLLHTALGEWAARRIARLIPNPCADEVRRMTSPVRFAVTMAKRVISRLIDDNEPTIEVSDELFGDCDPVPLRPE